MKVIEYLVNSVKSNELGHQTISGKLVMFIPNEDIFIIDSFDYSTLAVIDRSGTVIEATNRKWLYSKLKLRKNVVNILEVFHQDTYTTILIKEVYNAWGEQVSRQIKGFYHGRPNKESTKKFYNKYKVKY